MLNLDHELFTIGLCSIHLVTIGKIIEISSTEKFVFRLQFQIASIRREIGKKFEIQTHR